MKDETKNTNIQQALSGALRGRTHGGAALRMTPLIDMIFLLLIFFLVTANFRPDESFLPIQLPAAQAQGLRLGIPEPLVISIFAIENGCEVQIGSSKTVEINTQSQQADLNLLVRRISNVMRAQKRTVADPIEIVCQSDVKWEHLVRIYNVLFGMGINDITFCMTGQDDECLE